MKKTITESLVDTPLECIQIYVSNPRGFRSIKIDIRDLQEAQAILVKTNKRLYIHGCLMYNMAGEANPTDAIETKRRRTVHFLTEELDIGAVLNAPVVVHTGSCKNKDLGMRNIAKTVEEALTKDGPNTAMLKRSFGDVHSKRMILLENAAGEGNKLGATLQEFKTILGYIPKEFHSRIGICIDTAHCYGAGICDFTDFNTFIQEFDSTIGLQYLKLIHLNDSMVVFKSRTDRHAHLGTGHIFNDSDGFRKLKSILDTSTKYNVDCIFESPGVLVDKTPVPGWWDYYYCILASES
jgi:apurinic endonuclease APN1